MKLHIGREIEARYKDSGIKISEFARRINTTPRNVYTIFERSDIKTDLLQKIGEVLRFNFFALYEAGPDIQEPGSQYLPESQKSRVVSVIVDLDGEESTLNQWIKRLTAINKTIG